MDNFVRCIKLVCDASRATIISSKKLLKDSVSFDTRVIFIFLHKKFNFPKGSLQQKGNKMDAALKREQAA
jgi:hypothetical protein